MHFVGNVPASKITLNGILLLNVIFGAWHIHQQVSLCRESSKSHNFDGINFQYLEQINKL